MIPQFKNIVSSSDSLRKRNRRSSWLLFLYLFLKEGDNMPRRKKYPRLPNGFGQIRYLGKNRRNPYGVYPPATEEYDSGRKKSPQALCYVSDWMVGFAVLTAYKSGTYTPGMETELAELQVQRDTYDLAQRILSDYNQNRNVEKDNTNTMTFAELYEEFYKWKFKGKKKYSQSSKNSSRAGFRNCSVIHTIPIADVTYKMTQDILDNCTLKHSSVELVDACLKQCFRYAVAQGYLDKNPTELLKINIEDDDEHGVPFTNDDLQILWRHQKNDIAQILLILCYSGFRIGELKVIDVNLKEKYFSGGLKTRASKERIVPIHSKILGIVNKRIEKDGCLMEISYHDFQVELESYLSRIGISKHTSHDCRHTFSRLCEEFSVRENDRKRMLGHKFNEITNDVYGHRDVEQLRIEIEKITI